MMNNDNVNYRYGDNDNDHDGNSDDNNNNHKNSNNDNDDNDDINDNDSGDDNLLNRGKFRVGSQSRSLWQNVHDLIDKDMAYLAWIWTARRRHGNVGNCNMSITPVTFCLTRIRGNSENTCNSVIEHVRDMAAVSMTSSI